MENPSVKWGVYLAIASIAVYLIFYLVDPNLIFSINSYIGWVLAIVFLVFSCKERRTDLGGFASFGEMFKTGFLTFIISGILSLVFQYVMTNFIDPGLLDLQREISIEAVEKMSGLLGEEGIEAAIEKIENDNPMSVMNMGFALVGLTIIGAIVAAIIGAIMQKKNPADF